MFHSFGRFLNKSADTFLLLLDFHHWSVVLLASPFVPKKFPNELKPSTLRIAQMALDMNEYDECFFIRLAQLFPYNTFTIKVGQSRILQPFENPDNPKKTMLQKFVKREILPQRKAYYKSEIDLRIARLNEMIIEGMPAAREDYEAAMREYQRTKRAYDERHPEEPSGALPTNASTILGDTVMKNPFDQSMTDPAEKPRESQYTIAGKQFIQFPL